MGAIITRTGLEKIAQATVDMMNRLIARVETLENDKQELVEASIGVDKWFNTDDRYKDQDIVIIGVKTYALMDSSNILSISEYPILFKNINAVDRGDGTFAMPNFNDGTTRHLPKGTSRPLGSFEDFAMQNFSGKIEALYGDNSSVSGNGIFKLTRNSSEKREAFEDSPIDSVDIELDLRDIRTAEETRMKNTSGQWYILARVDI